MLKKNLIFLSLLLLSTGMLELHAQKSIVAAGGQATGSTGSVSYSVGQLDYLAINTANGSVAQGVQQPVFQNPLPITLLGFKATKQDSKVLLTWETSTEINSSKFIVRRSKDGVTYTAIKQVGAAGNSNTTLRYATEDLQPLSGWNYYRLQLIDKDGSYIYSKVGVVNFDLKTSFAIIYPNPTKGNIRLQMADGYSGKYTYKVFDSQGKLIVVNTVSNDNTNIRLTRFAAGSYYLNIIDQNNQIIKSFQIIKTN